MPQVKVSFSSSASVTIPSGRRGPILDVSISHPNPLHALFSGKIPAKKSFRRRVLKEIDRYVVKGEPLPKPRKGKILIDTGATRTCVDTKVLKYLRIKPTTRTRVTTPTGTSWHKLFPARLELLGAPFPMIQYLPVIGVNLAKQDEEIIALLGRDVLSQYCFIFQGPQGEFQLALQDKH